MKCPNVEIKDINCSTEQKQHQQVKRIGLLLCGFKKINLSALKYLILQMNSLQRTFEYEFLPTKPGDKFLEFMSSKSPINREKVKDKIPAFIDDYKKYLSSQIASYQLKESLPDYFVLVTMARYSDNFYSTRKGDLSVLALGNWKRAMSPPSLLEFILTLIVREALSSVSKSLRGSIHLGTKGCLCDFTPYLEEVRLKVLSAFICNHCRKALQHDKLPTLADEITLILRKHWIGQSSEPNSPASIALKLGYNLFTTSGIKATYWERFVISMHQEGIKQLIKVIGGIILAGLLLWLGLK